MTHLVKRVNKFFTICIVLFLIGTYCLTADESESWIFSATRFESSIENDPAATLLPLYIIENFSDNLYRSVSAEEQRRLAIQAFDNDLRVLFESLQKEVFEKDALLVTQKNATEYTESVREKELAIEKIRFDIQQIQEQKEKLVLEDFEVLEKKIELWENGNSLYEVDENKTYFNPQNIHALISGSVEYIDDFIYVTSQLVLYPGKIIAIEIREVDSISNIQSIAQRISDSLYLSLTNKELVTIHFDIEPKEALDTATIYINGTTYQRESSDDEYFASVHLPSGVYEFYATSPGYEGVTVTYSFDTDDAYAVSIHLKDENPQSISYTIPGPNGNLFINTQKMISTNNADSANTEGIATINGLPALGEFVSEDGISTWFFVNEASENSIPSLAQSDIFSFIPNTENFEDVIEKNRKRMYNSYAALILSLPVYFIANGQYLNEYNSWATNKSDGNNLQAWQTARDVTMGLSIGLGINFLIQLGIYIHSANTILPEEVSVND